MEDHPYFNFEFKVHLDIKPPNLVVFPGNRIKLVDLGIAQKAYERRLVTIFKRKSVRSVFQDKSLVFDRSEFDSTIDSIASLRRIYQIDYLYLGNVDNS